jgi:hypothetical protein
LPAGALHLPASGPRLIEFIYPQPARPGNRSQQLALKMHCAYPMLVLVRLASSTAPPSDHQVEDQNAHGYDQKNVNQAAGDVETKTQEPQNEKNYKNRPKHRFSFLSVAGA